MEKEEIYDLPIGTTIMTYDRIEDDKYKGVHFGIILGRGIILSKLGYTHNGGEIAVTNIEELEKVYSFNFVRIMTKK